MQRTKLHKIFLFVRSFRDIHMVATSSNNPIVANHYSIRSEQFFAALHIGLMNFRERVHVIDSVKKSFVGLDCLHEIERLLT